MGVAGDAGEDLVVGGVRVAVGATGPAFVMSARVDGERRVIERRAAPRGGVVTGGASGGKGRGDVVGVRRRLIDGLVTVVAIGGSPPVHASDVTVHARDTDVGAGQRKGGQVVVEGGRGPGGGAMTNIALLGKLRCYVVRIGGGVETCQMARYASRAEPGKLTTRVAAGASQGGMCSRKSEASPGVIEDRARPGERGVAERAVRREAGRDVIRIGGPVVCIDMAGGALDRSPRELVIQMAGGTGQLRMGARQRESDRSVIEVDVSPGVRDVAERTIGREARGGVVGVARGPEVRRMASDAGRWCPLKTIPRVASDAGK